MLFKPIPELEKDVTTVHVPNSHPYRRLRRFKEDIGISPEMYRQLKPAPPD